MTNHGGGDLFHTYGLGEWPRDVPRQMVSEVVIPSVGRAGSGSTDFLAELNDAVEANTMQ